ncbi:hypothetical protein M413DRAFT_336324 [Hebeloma cylindrosporum]|uniref:Uncharacterized protein n=1 Tax=Hebeloma cylindrosporum TaxID=76867 RepID=A0A0C3C8T6_HEBCY|nr:hypothetical protein M413DRAFT_336324 [Hebeloma cylindrosporum h7]
MKGQNCVPQPFHRGSILLIYLPGETNFKANEPPCSITVLDGISLERVLVLEKYPALFRHVLVLALHCFLRPRRHKRSLKVDLQRTGSYTCIACSVQQLGSNLQGCSTKPFFIIRMIPKSHSGLKGTANSEYSAYRPRSDVSGMEYSVVSNNHFKSNVKGVPTVSPEFMVGFSPCTPIDRKTRRLYRLDQVREKHNTVVHTIISRFSPGVFGFSTHGALVLVCTH